jgi:hypothetical protein
MKNKIWEFILKRLEDKGVNIDSVKMQSSEKDGFYRYFAKEGDKTHIFSVLKNEEDSKLKWYKSSHFDGSMNKTDKESVMKEHPVEGSVKEYFKQEFEVDSQSFLFRWS